MQLLCSEVETLLGCEVALVGVYDYFQEVWNYFTGMSELQVVHNATASMLPIFNRASLLQVRKGQILVLIAAACIYSRSSRISVFHTSAAES